jgi:uncharacterized protein (DUF2461 family)
MTAFAGFPPETIRFLRELRANNRKDWFDAHRDDYEAYWVAPAKAFVVAAGRQLAELVPQIRAEPRVLGSILRVNRDTRFSRDPSPYKDHLDFWFWEGERRQAVSGFFARLTPEALGVGAGYQLGGATLKRPPAGFADGGPAGRFLLHKALFVHRDEPADERIQTDAVLAACMRHWRALAPLHRWLTDNVQAP